MRYFIHAAIAALGLCSLSAHASVFVDTSTMTPYAYGSMATAAVTGQENAYIYCTLTGNVIACGAGDGVSQSGYCYSDEYKYKRLFPAVGKSAILYFSWEPVSHRCTSMQVTNYSGPMETRAPAAPRFEDPAVVEPDYHFAYGTLSAPRTGANEQITCQVRGDVIECVAVDRSDVLARCVAVRDAPTQTYDDMRLAALGVNESSYVFFQWDDALPVHNCTQLYIANSSQQLP